MANEIRPDLKDISSTVDHLLKIGRYLGEKSIKWTRFWNGNKTRDVIHQSGNKELIIVFEELYARSVGTAGGFGELLQRINYIELCPRLKEYVKKIRLTQEQWIDEDSELISRATRVISRCEPKIDLSAVKLMLRWPQEIYKILKNLDTELAQIENSERYRIENPLCAGKDAEEGPPEKTEPADLISLVAVIRDYQISRAQIKRDIDSGTLKSYRKKPRGKHVVSREKAGNLYTKK